MGDGINALRVGLLGDDVNLAQRLESKAPIDGILISEKTYHFVKERVDVVGPRELKIKGYDDHVLAYKVKT